MRIQDILEGIAKIERYMDGKTFQDFVADTLLVDAVLRNLEVIGEAAGHVPEDRQTRHPEIPWYEIKGMRNLVAHEYFGVSLDIVWLTVHDDLGPIVPLLTRMLAED